jgi:hypothetical protein
VFESSNANLSDDNGIIVSNCSFLDLFSRERPPIMMGNCYPNITVWDCIFRNISNSNDSPAAGGFMCNIGSSNNEAGNCNISKNIFVNMKTNGSAMYINGSFSLLIFSYNSFFNVSSTKEGGVYLILILI